MPSRSAQNVIQIVINADDNASGTMENIGGGIQRFGQAAVAAFAVAGAAATAFAVSSINEFAQFQEGMNEVFTLIPDASGAMLDRMDTQVKQFAARFGTLPNEVIPALYQSISAGVPPDNVFTFLETAQKAAIGGVTDLETAVDGISSVVNAYGADILSATAASDLMFTSVRLGKTTFGELSAALFQVTPTAASLGLEFGNVTAALAAMTSQGVPTSVASTQLRQLLVELSRAGTEASDAFTQIAGVGFRDFLTQGGNLQDALVIMQRAADQSGVSLADMFGSVEAGNAALALTGAGAQRFADFLAEMQASAGATDTAFETMEKGLGRSFDRLRASFSVLRIEVGERLAPIVQPLVDGLTSLINVTTLLVTGDFRGGIFGWEEDSSGIEMLFDFRKRLIDSFEGIKRVFISFDYFMSAVRDFGFAEAIRGIFGTGSTGETAQSLLEGILVAFDVSRESARRFAHALGELVEPFIALGERIGGFISTHVEWRDVLVAIGIAMSTAVVPGLVKMLGAIIGFGSPIGLLITSISILREVWETDFLGIKTFITTEVAPKLEGFFKNIGAWITTEALPNLEKFGNWFTTEALPGITAYIEGDVQPVLDTLFGGLQTVWNDVSPSLGSLFDWFIKDGLNLVVNFVKTVGVPGLKLIGDILGHVWDIISPQLESVYNWFVAEGLPGIVAFIEGPATTAINGLVKGLGDVVKGLQNWINKNPEVIERVTTVIEIMLALKLGLIATTFLWGLLTTGIAASVVALQAFLGFLLLTVAPLVGIGLAIDGVRQALDRFNASQQAAKDVGVWGGQVLAAGSAAGRYQTRQQFNDAFFAELQKEQGDLQARLLWNTVSFQEALGRAWIAYQEGGGTGGGRALGGDVYAGMSYTVGERGPETFVPNQDGYVNPGVSGGASITINFNGPGPANVSQAEEAGRVIVRRLRSEGF